MLVKKDIKCKICYPIYMHYIQNLLSIYNMIKDNLINIPIIKKSIILFNKSKDVEFDVSDY